MTREVTQQGFIWTHIGVIVAVIIAAGTGAIAWGQTQEKVKGLEGRQDRIEKSLENLRTEQTAIQHQQQRNTGTLEKLDERSKQGARTQQRILNAVDRLDQRLDGNPR